MDFDVPDASLASLGEQTLIEQIVAGDEDALAGWFDQQKNPLYAFIYYRVGGDPDLAADVTQATFTTALERLTEFEPTRGDMITWLRFLSRNIIRDTLLTHRRGVQFQAAWDRVDAELQIAYQRLDSELLPDAVLEREETRELVDVAMSNLPSQYREVLQAKYVDNFSLEHIAGLRDTTIDSVKSMLRRARAAFRECFLAIAKVEMSDV
jgi:RNA polymerase sigma-70 factor (ECF subfamily)